MEFKTYEEVFSKETLDTLHHLANTGYIDELYGTISTGKEANVFYGKDFRGKEVAVKIYRINTSDFERMWKYIKGDERFEDVSMRKRKIVKCWAEKEFKNLERAQRAGLDVPRPLKSKSNVLVMDFIGEDGKAAPIADKSPPKEPKEWLDKILGSIEDLYKKENLVHSDLSSYNILNWEEEPYFIDFGQGVVKRHPKANKFLKRDIENITRWLSKKGVKTPDVEKVFNRITT